MRSVFLFKSLKEQTVRNKFNLLIALIIVILLFSLLNALSSVKVMSGIRAYVGGEGLWSKGQKEAVNSLVAYTHSHDEADYQKFLHFVDVPLGDKQARLEMNKPNPDYSVVRVGFIQGGNSPDDVNDMIFLYRNFRHSRLMSPAISIWAQGDAEMANLLAAGDRIHALIAPNASLSTAQNAQLASLLTTTYASDSRLTSLENQFSASLGLGSRRLERVLFELTVVTTGILGVLTLVVASLSARAIIRLDRLKTEFVSLASHQLRTPLTAINWYAESLLSENAGPLNPKQQQYISELYNGGQRMASLISDLLKVSSLDLGTYKPEVKNVDVTRALDTAIRDLQPQIDQKQISVKVAIDSSVPTVSIAEQFFMGVLQNLLSNSVKYTKKNGKINVTVRKQRSAIVVEVADNGVGIPEEQQSQIFKKLFRADNAQKLDANGTGLGLYIVKAMVRHMDGKVWFESVEGRSTTFYVRLPIRSRYHEKAIANSLDQNG